MALRLNWDKERHPDSKTVAILAASVLGIMALTYILIAFTGLKRTIPGYPSRETRLATIENVNKVDSLSKVIDMWAFQVGNIQRIVNGQEPLPPDSTGKAPAAREYDEATRAAFAANDSILREEILRQEAFNVSIGKSTISQIEGMHFFTPIKGVIAAPFDEKTGHPFLDIASETEKIVYAVYDGTVINSYWSDLAENVIMIQHRNNLVSVYKHTAKLLKNTGDKVTAGTPIAVVSDVATNGAHLYLEFWHEGKAIDPADYIKF
ncbi:MAG: M23 family metallopeptidase [Bacteroidales bacterium]|nr:M23 family metallopeptidase [Bacteroidales bacterium]